MEAWMVTSSAKKIAHRNAPPSDVMNLRHLNGSNCIRCHAARSEWKDIEAGVSGQ